MLFNENKYPIVFARVSEWKRSRLIKVLQLLRVLTEFLKKSPLTGMRTIKGRPVIPSVELDWPQSRGRLSNYHPFVAPLAPRPEYQ